MPVRKLEVVDKVTLEKNIEVALKGLTLLRKRNPSPPDKEERVVVTSTVTGRETDHPSFDHRTYPRLQKQVSPPCVP